MFASPYIDDRFLDRPGCGDELYLDSRFRTAVWLESLAGSVGNTIDFDLTFMEDDGDDAANH